MSDASRVALILLLFSLLALPPTAAAADDGSAALASNHETDWQPLFANDSFVGWKTTRGKSPGDGWRLKDGELSIVKPGYYGNALVSMKGYGDFELAFEWEIAERGRNDKPGNSGIKYRVQAFAKRWNGDLGPWWDGCEYQILHSPPKADWKGGTAALYSLYGPQLDNFAAESLPAGHGKGRIVSRGNAVEHWFNDQLVVTAQIGSEDWQERLSGAKQSNYPNYAETNSGRIMFTDHGSTITYRNLRIREF